MPVPAANRVCPSCGTDNGYPNVRLAETPEEKLALQERLLAAELSTKARGCRALLNQFGVAVLNSKVIIARSLAIVDNLVNNENAVYTTYHQQLSSGARTPQDNEYDLIRTQVEAALFPNFHQDIRFGNLTLGGLGLSGYGAYGMILREEMIAHRATVFEENPITFCKRHGLMLTDPIPFGYRAVWSERDRIAKAKLHNQITSATVSGDFPSILVNDRGGTANSDFIEGHIYGPLNRYSIEKVIGPIPRTAEDRILVGSLKHKLKSVGATQELG